MKRGVGNVDAGAARSAVRSRFLTRLNANFSEWVARSTRERPLSDWSVGLWDYVAAAKSIDETLALPSGRVFSFGSGDCGQLGHGVEGGMADLCVGRPRLISALEDVEAESVVCGGLHNLIVSKGGRVHSWGCSDDGVLGREGDENFPAIVPLPRSKIIVQVTAGDCHSAALTLDGYVYVWGTYKDKDGKSWFDLPGDSDPLRKTRSTPMLMQNVEKLTRPHGGVARIASGSHHTIAICGDGSLYSWGIGECGQLGRDVCVLKDAQGLYQKELVRKTHLTPAKVSMPARSFARSVSCGEYHTMVCMATSDAVFSCGLNNYGQLGVDPEKHKQVEALTEVEGLRNKRIVRVECGEHYSTALDRAGQLYSFGRADQHQLGYMFEEKEAGQYFWKPQRIGGALRGKMVVSVGCGSSHCAAVTADGELYTWGFGEMLQLGHGNNASDDEITPRLVKAKSVRGNKVLAVSSGGQHTVILVKGSR